MRIEQVGVRRPTDTDFDILSMTKLDKHRNMTCASYFTTTSDRKSLNPWKNK